MTAIFIARRCVVAILCDILDLITIIYTPAAARDFDRLTSDVQQRMEVALDANAMRGEGDVKALKGQAGYRLRVGSYRVIFAEDAATILAIYIGRRTTTTYRRN